MYVVVNKETGLESNMRVSSAGTKNWLESLEAILVFVVPLIVAIPLYVMGVLTEASGNYVMHAIYIACSNARAR